MDNISFEEWCKLECDEDITNKMFSQIFINNYFNLIKNYNKISGDEIRELLIKENPKSKHFNDILYLIYKFR